MWVSRTADVLRSSDGSDARAEIAHAEAQLYRPDVDGLRAVAALAVIAAHAGWLHGGGFGVDIFFVISGFLISGIIFRALQRGQFSLLDFYARRVKRIFPALIVLLASVAALGWIFVPSNMQQRVGGDIVAGAGFVENLWIYATSQQRSGAVDSLLTHLWTLGTEEQFYLGWPLLLATTWLLFRQWRLRLIAITAGLSLGSYGWTLFTDPGGWLLPWNRLWELALGALLACVQHAKSTGLRRAWSAWLSRPPISHSLGTLGAGCGVVALLGPAPLDQWPSGYAWVPVLGAVLVISAGPEQWINRRLLAARPMVFVGLMSYPLYLWHWSVFMFVGLWHGHTSTAGFRQVSLTWKIAAIAASLALAYVTYRFVEMPLRSARNTRGVALLLCLAMALCAMLAYAALG